MVKSNRRKINRRKPSRVRSEITRVGTGVPVSQKRVNSDPPMLPHTLAYPVRVRFLITALSSTGSQGYTVELAGTPTAANVVNLYYSPSTGAYSNNFGLTFNQVFTAAAMRIYGVDVTADISSANFVTTDYAIQKVVAYGTSNRSYTSPGIALAIDFGGDIPGFYGRDSGAANRRAVVAARPPRLSWQKIDTNSSFSFVSLNVGSYTRPDGAVFTGVGQRVEMGVLDFSVIVRRSVLTQSNAPAALSTYFVNDNGDRMTTSST